MTKKSFREFYEEKRGAWPPPQWDIHRTESFFDECRMYMDYLGTPEDPEKMKPINLKMVRVKLMNGMVFDGELIDNGFSITLDNKYVSALRLGGKSLHSYTNRSCDRLKEDKKNFMASGFEILDI